MKEFRRRNIAKLHYDKGVRQIKFRINSYLRNYLLLFHNHIF